MYGYFRNQRAEKMGLFPNYPRESIEWDSLSRGAHVQRVLGNRAESRDRAAASSKTKKVGQRSSRGNRRGSRRLF